MSDEHGISETDPSDEELKWPVGFLIMVGLAALYLVVRLVQLGARAVDWIF
jgi:hypothetical protein